MPGPRPCWQLSLLLASLAVCTPSLLRASGVVARCGPLHASASGTEQRLHRAGFITIVGVPNVGKSTLMNELVGERLAIITAKAQTTRHRILGIVNGDDFQIIYSDTPGVVLPQYKLHEGMMASVKGSLNDADAVLLVVDIFQEEFADEQILRQILRSPAPLIVVVNKVDLLHPDSPLSDARRTQLVGEEHILDRWRERFPGASVLPLSAKLGQGTQALLDRILAVLPEHEPFFPKDQLTDRPERFFASEMVREAIMTGYRHEVPYSCEVRITSFKELDEIIRITCEIYVAHESQKGIIIGNKGAALKAVGTRARKALEEFFVKKVYLETRVKVRKGWREDESALKDFGYLM
mmetsp:Transcript_47236/g.100822  ORF Transcript_47236/g.100822 Transcript_47236/m.100822 type:complete len:352 (-) Transcript_47236:242-1297(-)